MGRQLFLHHYLPALYFAILLACGVFDFLTSTMRPRVRLQIAAVIAILAIWNFQHFSPLAYGSPWTKAKCRSAQWMKTWDFSCNDFLDDYSQYNGIVAATPKKDSGVPVATIGGEPGGRAPIVVQDKLGTAIPPPPNFDDAADTTTIGMGKAEPGRDMFGGEPVKDIKSQNIPIPAEKEQEPVVVAGDGVEKEISQVFQPSQGMESVEVVAKKPAEPAVTLGNTRGAQAPAEPVVEAVVVENEPQLPAQKADVIPEGPVAEKVAEVPTDNKVAPAPAAGPVAEVEDEAARAAHELYPDAAAAAAGAK